MGLGSQSASSAFWIATVSSGTYKLTNTLYLNHETGGSCREHRPYGGWIAGAGSAVTKLQMASGLKKSVFATDGLGNATVQGITFKTWAWQDGDDELDPQNIQPNFDIEARRGFIASTSNSLYDVVFDGGWAGFATGVDEEHTLGQCDYNAIFHGSFKNAWLGFDSGHWNAIGNVAYDSSFESNQYSIGSRKALPHGDSSGTFAVYRSTSRGSSLGDVYLPVASLSYFYEWDTDSPIYQVTGAGNTHLPYLYENSHLAPVQTDLDYPYVFRIGSAGGPMFLYSRMDNGAVKVGMAGWGQSYAVKLASTIPDWDLSVENSLNGQLEELPALPLTIDDFEEGPVAAADYPATGVGGGESTSSEQEDLDPGHVAGGVRLLTLTAYAKAVMTAALAPIAESDDGLLLSSGAGNGVVMVIYDGIAGGATASGPAGGLGLDLSSFDAIVFDVAELDGDITAFQLSLSDSMGTSAQYGSPMAPGQNEFPLSSFTSVDLTDIRQIQFRLQAFRNGTTGGASVRVRSIRAVDH